MTAKCHWCGSAGEIESFPRINVAEDPDLKARVKDGSLFLWECPHCGRRNLALYPLLYHDPDARLMIWLLPEGSGDAEALDAALGSMDGELDGYTLRRVSDVGSLIEKLSICDAGLDDVTIEMCKYVTRMELAENQRDKAGQLMDAPFKFYRMQGADNELSLSFIMDGQVHSVNIGLNVYEDCRGILQRNPSVRPALGFAKVDAEWLAGVMR